MSDNQDKKEVLQKAYVFDTPDGIELYRLASLKGRLKLESAGLRGRGGATRPMLAKELGLSPRDSFGLYFAELQKRIDALKAKILRSRMTIEEIDGGAFLVMSGDRSATVMVDVDDVTGFRVTYQEAGVLDKVAKEPTFHECAPSALDAAEDWVCEVR